MIINIMITAEVTYKRAASEYHDEHVTLRYDDLNIKKNLSNLLAFMQDLENNNVYKSKGLVSASIKIGSRVLKINSYSDIFLISEALQGYAWALANNI